METGGTMRICGGSDPRQQPGGNDQGEPQMANDVQTMDDSQKKFPPRHSKEQIRGADAEEQDRGRNRYVVKPRHNKGKPTRRRNSIREAEWHRTGPKNKNCRENRWKTEPKLRRSKPRSKERQEDRQDK